MRKPEIIPSGFSLVELIAVAVIISILVGMGIPLYNRTVERARDQEAKANLMLILAAEKMYLAKNGNFYPSGGVADNINDINANLHLNLNENLWNYSIGVDIVGPLWTISASRNGGGFFRWYEAYMSMSFGYLDPVCDGSCP